MVQIRIFPYEDRYFQVGKSLLLNDCIVVLLSLAHNLDLLAWSPYEILDVDSTFITHKLSVDPLFLHKNQKPRRSARQHVEAMKEESRKVKAGWAIKEVFFPEWLSNRVVVKKKNVKWRVYVGFTDLN